MESIIMKGENNTEAGSVLLSTVTSELLERCRKREDSAFEELYAVIQRDLYAWIFSVMRNHDDTDEIFQECVIRIYKHLSSLRDHTKFTQWVSRIIINQCHTYRAKRARKNCASFDDRIEIANEQIAFKGKAILTPKEELYNKELRDEINCAIAKLPPKQRTAIMLFEIEGYQIKKIAQEWGAPKEQSSLTFTRQGKNYDGCFPVFLWKEWKTVERNPSRHLKRS